jgi:hypothetical protein
VKRPKPLLLFVFGGLLAILLVLMVYRRAGPVPQSAMRAEERAAVAPTNMVALNLTNFFNADLDVPWNGTSYPGDDLAELPRGLQKFDGVRFDIQGVIQLSGREWKKRGLRYPEKVEGMPVQRACRYLFLLHADGGAKAPNGTTVARVVLHYNDGTTAEIPIQHDIHVKDWWNYGQPPPSDPNTVVAWTGQNQATARMGKSIRLYKTRFENPFPPKRIESLDYVSAMEDPGPLLVAVTLQ